MILWLDAQLPPGLAPWLSNAFGIQATAVRDLGLRDATDRAIFQAARAANAVVATKDSDFVTLLEQHGAPPRVVWITAGNTSTARLKELLTATWPGVERLLAAGEVLVEISDRR